MEQKESLISLAAFRQFLFDNIIPLEDLNDFKGAPLNSILPFWRKKRLTPFIPSGKHKQSISFADLLWLRILDLLREFSYPIDKIQKVCDYFFKDAYYDELPKKNFTHNKNQFLKKKLAGTITENELQTLNFIEESINDDTFIYVLRFQINYLTNLVVDCLESRDDKGILIFKDGSVAELHGIDYYSHRNSIIDPSEPHIFISIRYLLREFIEDKELSSLFIPRILNEDEKKVLKELKSRNVKEITIQMQNGAVRRIESTKGGVITGEQAKEIRGILGLKNYEKITLDTVDEKTISIKKTKKKI
jgi:hypothetical protein